MSTDETTLEKRSIIVIGKTGAGKSKLLNELLCEKQLFKSSSGIESCTNKIELSDAKLVKCNIETKNNVNNEISFELNAFDTPGIGDSKGRSKQFLNDIAQTIKCTPLNLIIILVEYQRLDTGLCNNLEILRECLNGLSQKSSMLIVNKVPTLATLENKRKRGEEVCDRDTELKDTFKKLTQLLGNTLPFEFNIFLENDDTNFEINEEKYNWIRQAIFSCNAHLNASMVRTWDEILNFYAKEISDLTDQEFKDHMIELRSELENKLDKVEFDIADVKYSFLDFLVYAKCLNDEEEQVDSLIFSSLDELADFVEKFECSITKEKFYEQSKFSNDYIEYIQNRILIIKTTAPTVVKGAAGLFSGISMYSFIGSLASAPTRAVTSVFSTLAGSYALGSSGGTAAAAAGLVGTASTTASIAALTFSMAFFGAVTLGLAGVAFMITDKKNIDEKLNNLGVRRTELKKELEDCQGSLDQRKLLLEKKKAKITRLENALLNPNQI